MKTKRGLLALLAIGLQLTAIHPEALAIAPPLPEPCFYSSIIIRSAVPGHPISGSIADEIHTHDGEKAEAFFSILAGPAWLSISPDGTLSGTPTKADEGYSQWTVQAGNGRMAVTSTLYINVGIIPPPVYFYADAGPDQVIYADATGEAVVTLSATTLYVGAPYSWDLCGTSIAQEKTATVSVPIGSHTFTISADIGGMFQAQDRVDITVLPHPNRLTVDAGTDQRVRTKKSYATVSLNATGTGDIVDYAWKENGVRIAAGQTIEVDLELGEYTFVCRVKDSEGNVARDEVKITVEPAVVIGGPDPYFTKKTILKSSARIGKDFEKDIADKAIDPKGGSLAFAIVDGPNWLDITTDGILYGRPEKKDKGKNTFIVEARDHVGGIAEAIIKIKVK